MALAFNVPYVTEEVLIALILLFESTVITGIALPEPYVAAFTLVVWFTLDPVPCKAIDVLVLLLGYL